MRALILERNKKVARRMLRHLTAAGLDVVAVDDPGDVPEQLDAQVVMADAFDGDLVVQRIRTNPGLRGVLWTAEPLQRSLGFALGTPQISNILGRESFEAAPRPWELLMVAHRLAYPCDSPIGLYGFLDWGFCGFEERIASTEHRDDAVAGVQEFIARLGAPRRIGELFGELAHEALMNAMFDAPIDDRGAAVYAMDRKARIELPERDQPVLRVGCDGSRMVLQVADRFGRLRRKHVFDGLARGLTGELDTSGGGAGLGMAVCHNATVAMFFHVIASRSTEVTGVYDLDLNLREFRTRAKSLHFFYRDPARGGAPGGASWLRR